MKNSAAMNKSCTSRGISTLLLSSNASSSIDERRRWIRDGVGNEDGKNMFFFELFRVDDSLGPDRLLLSETLALERAKRKSWKVRL